VFSCGSLWVLLSVKVFWIVSCPWGSGVSQTRQSGSLSSMAFILWQSPDRSIITVLCICSYALQEMYHVVKCLRGPLNVCHGLWVIAEYLLIKTFMKCPRYFSAKSIRGEAHVSIRGKSLVCSGLDTSTSFHRLFLRPSLFPFSLVLIALGILRMLPIVQRLGDACSF